MGGGSKDVGGGVGELVGDYGSVGEVGKEGSVTGRGTIGTVREVGGVF